MKIVIASLLVMAGVSVLGSDISPNSNGQPSSIGVGVGIGLPGKGGNNPPVVVRGWQIVSAQSSRRASITTQLEQFERRISRGSVRVPVGPNKGSFLVVLVQCKWATAQPANEALWTGKPDVVLVDEAGVEYPAVSKLRSDAGDLVQVTMPTGAERRGRRPLPASTASHVIYFDVPSTSQAFRLRFTNGAEIALGQVLVDLPAVETDPSDD